MTKERDLELAVIHSDNAKMCLYHLKHFLKQDNAPIEKRTEVVITAIDVIIKHILNQIPSDILFEEGAVSKNLKSRYHKISIGKAVYFVMSPLRVLQESQAELRRAYKNLRKYKEFYEITDALSLVIYKLQEIEIDVKDLILNSE